MDLFGWFWLVGFCIWWFGVSVDGMGRKFLSYLHGASPVLLETGFWDFVLYLWAICAIIAILVVSMARSKNIGKGKAPSSSMERAVKKRKSDSSQPVKKGKGKQIESSSESEEVSDSDDDEEIEAMFAEDSESEQEKWAQSIANRDFIGRGAGSWRHFCTLIPSGELFKNRICSSCAMRFRDISLLWFGSFIPI